MGSFELYLDESGDFFKDTIGKEVPSVVGGLLFPNVQLKEIVSNFFMSLCEKYDIEVSSYHSTELPKEKFSMFSLELLEYLRETGIKLVIFENFERVSILDGTVTYLNIISEGLIQLFQTISLEEKNINVSVTAAVRMSPEEKNGSRYLRKIQSEEYSSRIKEKLTVGIARKNLSSSINKWHWSFCLGSARKDILLKIADTICHAYFRKDRKFNELQREKLTCLFDPFYLFTVFEHETAISIKRLLSEGMVGMALFEWIIADRFSVKLNYSNHLKNEFLDFILNRLKQLPQHTLNAELQVFSTAIQNLNHVERDFERAKKTLEKVSMVLIPKMKEEKIFPTAFFLDIYLSLFTTATHQGYILLADKQIQSIKELLSKQGKRWENINFILDFVLREAVHELNKYNYEITKCNMDRLEEFLEQLLSILPIAGDIDYFNDSFRSDIKGKILGTRLQAYLMEARAKGDNKEAFDKAIQDSQLAIEEFEEGHNRNRQYQYRSQIECDRGNVDEAYYYLCKSFNLTNETQFQELLKVIKQELKPGFLFGLMHYVRLMSELSRKNERTLATRMYTALINSGALQSSFLKNDISTYPSQVIFWKIGSYLANMGNFNSAQNYYKKALEICQEDKLRFTIRSIGLGIAFEQASLMLQGERKIQKEAKKALKYALKLYEQWMEEELPCSMRDFFAGWHHQLLRIDDLSDIEKSKVLYQLSRRVPY